MIRVCLLASALYFSPVLAFGQSIEVGQLGTAGNYEVGILNSSNGGLDQNLWQNTSAERAAHLIKTAPIDTATPLAQNIFRAVLLSEGASPRAVSPSLDLEFKKARIQAAIRLGEMSAAQSIMARTPELSADNELKADLALIAGDNSAACAVADTVIQGRAAPYWAKLRAFCHIVRDEIPAAEVTTDILRSSGHEDPAYFNLMRLLGGGTDQPDLNNVRASDALHVAMTAKASLPWPSRPPNTLSARVALSPLTEKSQRLSALYAAGQALSDGQIIKVLSDFAQSGDILAGGAGLSVVSAINAPTAEGTAQLFEIAQTGSQYERPKAAAEFLRRANRAGAFERFADLLTPALQTLSPEEQVLTDLKVFTGAAIIRRDIGALQGFHRLLEDAPEQQSRLALIADAVGFGFQGSPQGLDIELRLAREDGSEARARRDAVIAAAMGASLSDKAVIALEKSHTSEGRKASAGALIAMQTTAKASARAETALRAAALLSGEPLDDASLYAVIDALNTAGLSRFASRVAAEDFLMGLPE